MWLGAFRLKAWDDIEGMKKLRLTLLVKEDVVKGVAPRRLVIIIIVSTIVVPLLFTGLF